MTFCFWSFQLSTKVSIISVANVLESNKLFHSFSGYELAHHRVSQSLINLKSKE